MVVTAFQPAPGVVNLITPTSAVVMGGLALAKVRYDEFLRFVAPLLLGLLVACTPSWSWVPRSSDSAEVRRAIPRRARSDAACTRRRLGHRPDPRTTEAPHRVLA